jgi:WD40 repeat protein
MRVIKLKGVKRINGLHYAPDGRLLVVCGHNGQWLDTGFWVNVSEGKEVDRIGLLAACYAVAPDLSKLVLGLASDEYSNEGAGVFWFDPTEDADYYPIQVADAPHSIDIVGLAFATAGDRLAVSYRNETVAGFVITPVGSRRKRMEMAENFWACRLLAFSPDGKRIATCAMGDEGINILDGSRLNPDRICPVLLPDDLVGSTSELLYSPDGRELAVAAGRGVYLVREEQIEPRLTLAHPKPVSCVAFSPDGRHLVSGCQDKQVRVWDLKTGELLRSYDWQVGAVTALAFAPDGLIVAAGGEKGQVVVWDWE